jgi:hypothetical protein
MAAPDEVDVHSANATPVVGELRTDQLRASPAILVAIVDNRRRSGV